jgi:ADP-ribose pyrophosphatase
VNDWTINSKEIKYSNAWIDLIHHEVINPAGKEGIYGMVHFKNTAAAVVPIDSEGYTYLVGQYRFTLNEYSWEIPMGGCPLNEEPLEGAKRELLEETGLVAQNWLLLGKIHTSNSVTDEIGFIYLAQNLKQFKAEPEETENLAIKRIPLKEAVAMAVSGEITDSISLAALLKVALLLPEYAF